MSSETLFIFVFRIFSEYRQFVNLANHISFGIFGKRRRRNLNKFLVQCCRDKKELSQVRINVIRNFVYLCFQNFLGMSTICQFCNHNSFGIFGKRRRRNPKKFLVNRFRIFRKHKDETRRHFRSIVIVGDKYYGTNWRIESGQNKCHPKLCLSLFSKYSWNVNNLSILTTTTEPGFLEKYQDKTQRLFHFVVWDKNYWTKRKIDSGRF